MYGPAARRKTDFRGDEREVLHVWPGRASQDRFPRRRTWGAASMY